MTTDAGHQADVFYVWHLPVRIAHWSNVLAFFALVLTGLYIGGPMIPGQAPPMSYVRAIHMIAGCVLLCGVALRFYWAFVGDRGASWRSFFPYLRKDGWSKIYQEMRFYLFLRRDPPLSSAVVNVSHSFVFLGFVVEIVTGFALYFGWHIFALAPQTIRFVHVAIMWLLLAFTVEHLFIAVLLDCKERSALISSIVTGYMGHERKS